MIGAIGINLRRLRKMRRMTQGRLAELAGISRVAYRNLETGASEPRRATLEALADALDVPVFDIVAEVPVLRALRFRLRKAMTAAERAEREQIAVDVARWLEDFNEIEEIVGERMQWNLPDSLRDIADPVGAAGGARSALGLGPEDCINDISGLFERAGIKILMLESSLRTFFGLSVGREDGGPAIAVNSARSIPVERQIFTAAHELGHLLLHKESYVSDQVVEDPGQERQADIFAGHFLMPREHFERVWSESRGLSWVDSVLRIKRLFNVSYKTVLHRLIDEEIADGSIFSMFIKSYNERHDRRLEFREEPEAYLTAREEPSLLDRADFVEDRLSRLVMKAVEENMISMSRGAEILGMSVSELRERVAEWGMFGRPDAPVRE
ncbi:MAG: XRE family transcriptional regulator [Candidatus Krumholzibacteria bacterium]|nr:XRE family transcriptional regulator [Candidatus Krumholzibacteria bacterium]